MRISSSSRRSTTLSLLAHACVLALILAAARLHPIRIVNTKLPGTAAGTHIMLSYNTGGPAAPPVPTPRPRPKPRPSPLPQPAAPPPPKPAPPAVQPSTSGSGSTGDSSFGDGNIRIALVQLHPRPQPDLSALPPGPGGDIILDAVIDDHGRIASLTVTRSLGPSIDQTVLATVRGWTFLPATRNGVPTASEQELLFHYERS